MRIFSAFTLAVILTYTANVAFESWIEVQNKESIRKISDINYHVYSLMLEFKWVVQSWKDVLLRGHNPDDLRKYTADIKKFHTSILDMVQSLQARIKPTDQNLVDEFSRREKDLVDRYDASLLLALQNPDFDYRAADRAVRGKDRPVLEPLTALISSITSQTFNQIEDGYRRATNVRIGCLSFFVASMAVLWLLVRRQVKRRIDQEESQEMHSVQLQSLGRVLASTIHEIKNHVTVIDGRARQLQAVIAQPPQTTEKAKKYADDIMRVNRRTDDLVGSITRFSQPTLLDRRKSTAISDLVSEAQLIIQPKLATSMVTLTLLIAEPDIAVHCSDVEISQVLINLLGNSADAIQTMEPEQRWIRLEVNSDQGMVKFTITDSGPGISQDDLKKMSKVFFTTKEQGKGTGQGLAYCKSIIARHQGRFAYDNESVNTRFVFWLPAAEKSSDAAAA